MEKIKKLWEKFKLLSLKAEFIFGFPFVLFGVLAFALKSVLMVFVLAVWTVVFIINQTNADEKDSAEN